MSFPHELNQGAMRGHLVHSPRCRMMECPAPPRNRDPRGLPMAALQSPLKRIKISLYARGRLASRTEMGTLPTSMPISAHLPFETLNGALKAAGEATRLRILALLAEAELTVSELTAILRQSQPRISRHLRLLAEAGL